MTSLIVKTGARLHFNSLLMNDVFGQGCGGVGVMLKEPNLLIKFTNNRKISLTGPKEWVDDAKKFTYTILRYLNIKSGIEIKITKYFPRHIGLGSGTQLGMSIGIGIAALFRKKLSFEDIAKLTKRAGVSGVGYYGFIYGGFIIDGGYPMGKDKEKRDFSFHSTKPPCLVARYKFPKEWKILLIIPKNPEKYRLPDNENKFFKNITPVPLKEVQELCLNSFPMSAFLQDKDYSGFIKALERLSKLGTKRAEVKLNEKYYKEIKFKLQKILYKEIPFLGVSSLGPTMYSIILNNSNNQRLIKKINFILKGLAEAKLTTVKNFGAKIYF